MRASHLKFFVPVLAALVFPKLAFAAPDAEAVLRDASGKQVGVARFTGTPKGVSISIRADGLPEGSHGIHIHETGKCEGPDFKSAGAHFSAGAHQHGLSNPKGPHSGDLPALQVGKDGTAVAELLSPRVTLGPGKSSLLKSGGTAFVIHAKADDQKTDPSGNSGDRIACGVIKAR